MWPDKDKKGWVLRSYDNNSYFDEKSVPHSIRAAPAARARELRLKYEPRCHCLISRGPGTQHLPYIIVVCRPGRQVRCKVTPSRECFVVENVRSLPSETTHRTCHKQYEQTRACQLWCYLHSQKLHFKWFKSDVFVFARSVKLWWQLESKCQAWLTTTDTGLWLVSSTFRFPLIGWQRSDYH